MGFLRLWQAPYCLQRSTYQRREVLPIGRYCQQNGQSRIGMNGQCELAAVESRMDQWLQEEPAPSRSVWHPADGHAAGNLLKLRPRNQEGAMFDPSRVIAERWAGAGRL